MPPNSRPDSDTDHQRWLASQGRRPSDDSIPIPIPRYGPYENDPYEMYDGDDVRPENVASYEAMHKPTNPNNNNDNLPPSNPENHSQTLTYRTCTSDMAVYYISVVVLLLVIRYAWRSQRQRQRQSDEGDEEEELKPASRERFSTTGVTVDTTEQEKEKKRF